MDWLDYCLPLVKRSEGLRLSAYKCPAGVWTIGYGDTGPHVHEGLTWTAQQAESVLSARLRAFQRDVAAKVRVPVSPQQMAALVSLVFNIGSHLFGQSTLLKKLNAGDYDGAAREFDRFVYAAGRKLPGLITRRAAERALFEQGA